MTGDAVRAVAGNGVGDHRDDEGRPVRRARVVRRVVSLVPSLTEAVAVSAPGLLVGATDWCTHPADLDVTRVKGTKNPHLDTIIGLRPDLVLANFEENRVADLDALRAAGVPVWVTVVRTVPEGIASLERMLRFCGVDRPAWLHEAEQVWRDPPAGAPAQPRRTAVIPVWRRPWMACGSGTFTGDVLARMGVDNVLADSPERYPRFDPMDVTADLAVLPDEPYLFTADDGPEAFPGMASALVSGRHLTWYGPSLAQARSVLAEQLAATLPPYGQSPP